MATPILRRAALLAASAVVALAAAACGRVEGKTAWEEALHTQPPAPRVAGDAAFPVDPPPFSKGIFPCTRCHEGGDPAPAETKPGFTHQAHLDRGLECATCHMPEDEDAPRMPPRTVCDECHGDPSKFSDAARAYFASVTTADGGTSFTKRWTTRDTNEEHARHIGAEVACESCHGAASNAPFAKPRPVTLMQTCVSCHEERSKPVKCETCHSATPGKAHANIVLHHAEDQRGCLDCHDAADRDRLRLASGTKISFDESYRLCGQCHGTQFRDWKIGLHGRRTGAWNGRREYRLCVHCHSPHDPRFQPMTPVALPARPEEVR